MHLFQSVECLSSAAAPALLAVVPTLKNVCSNVVNLTIAVADVPLEVYGRTFRALTQLQSLTIKGSIEVYSENDEPYIVESVWSPQECAGLSLHTVCLDSVRYTANAGHFLDLFSHIEMLALEHCCLDRMPDTDPPSCTISRLVIAANFYHSYNSLEFRRAVSGGLNLILAIRREAQSPRHSY